MGKRPAPIWIWACSMTVVRLDFETRSTQDIKKVGVWRYASDPEADILCAAYSIDDGPVISWVPGEPAPEFPNGSFFEAHNAAMERATWTYVATPRYEWPACPPVNQWRCTAARAAFASLPRKLETVAAVLETATQKDMRGNRDMLYLAKPFKGKFRWDTERFKNTLAYNRDDIETERDVSKHRSLPYLTKPEQKIWELDQLMNTRGVCVDVESCRAAVKMVEEYRKIKTPVCKEITGGIEPNQTKKLTEWLGLPNLQAATLEAAVAKAVKEQDKDRLLVMQIRQATSQASVAKFKALLSRVESDGRAREMLLYHAAHTGRWAGRGFQPQNLPRRFLSEDQDAVETALEVLREGCLESFEFMYGDLMDALSRLVRPMMIGTPRLLAGDYATVEVRVLFWLAGAEFGLQQFAEGRDLYKEIMAQLLNKPVSLVTKFDRQFGKTIILGLGFQMGMNTFWGEALKTDPDVEHHVVTEAHELYRSLYWEVVDFWDACDKAAKAAVLNPGKTYQAGRTFWRVQGDYLLAILPSGHPLRFYKPFVALAPMPWDKNDRRPQLHYWGANSKTKQWGIQRTYGGKLAENVTQAAARDVLAEGMVRLEGAGYPMVLSIHDEAIAEDEDKPLDRFLELMAEPPTWSDGLPIGVEGWEGHRYRKD